MDARTSNVDAVLDRMTTLGVARVAQVVRVPGGSMEGRWFPFDELLDDIDRRIVAVRRRLDDVRPAVAASMLARSVLPLVVTPTAVAWSLFRAIPDLRARNLLVGFVDDLPAAVAMRTPRMVGPASVEWWAEAVLEGVCARLIDGLRSTVAVGSRHLWGNVGLAIAAPFGPLLASGHHDGRADRDLLLGQRPGLASTVEILDVSVEDRALDAVRRRTCCLLTKLPEPHRAMCGTCSLRPRDEQVGRLAIHYQSLAADAAAAQRDGGRRF